MSDVEETSNGITARYKKTEDERQLIFTTNDRVATIVQNTTGYAMLKVRTSAKGNELERYYGFEMALDHAAELLNAPRQELPIPEQAADMGM